MKGKTEKKVVIIGGGTGSYAVLSGLKKYDLELTAVVSMVDDGGSTGILRDELGVLPPGDVRQCLVALSNASEQTRDLFNYRFDAGTLKGHSFGNLFLSVLEKITGNFEKAVEKAGEVLSIQGKVMPVTFDPVTLCADLGNGKVVKGQVNVDEAKLYRYPEKKLYLEPKAKINRAVKYAILDADLVVVAPGTLYSSLVPNFLVTGMPEALHGTKARFLYVCNLVNKPNETRGYTVDDYVSELEGLAGREFDYVLYNTKKPKDAVMQQYVKKNELLVSEEGKSKINIITGDFMKDTLVRKKKGDTLIARSFIRHDAAKVAEAILKVLEKRK